MNHKISNLFIAAIFLFFAAACTDKAVSDFPVLTLLSPTAGQMYNPGDTVRMIGTASASATDDAHLLHDVMVEIKKSSDSSVLFTAHFDTHEMENFDFDTFYVAPAVSSVTDAFVLLQAENHLPMVSRKSVSIMIHP